MADLKLGTTVGGLAVWHKGNFPLVPAGNSITFNGYKMYTANDKPQAVDNDFVSKADGGQYQSEVQFKGGVKINATFSGGSDQMGIYSGNGDGASQTTTNLNIVSWYGVGFRSSQGSNGTTVWINTRTGTINTIGNITAPQYIATNSAPTDNSHLTRKDYVDSNINNVNNNANTRVLRSGDTMTGSLTAPQLTSNNPATAASHVPRLDQVITKGTIIDFGTY